MDQYGNAQQASQRAQMTEDDMMQTRMQLEKSYANKWQEGRRMRKNTD